MGEGAQLRRVGFGTRGMPNGHVDCRIGWIAQLGSVCPVSLAHGGCCDSPVTRHSASELQANDSPMIQIATTAVLRATTRDSHGEAGMRMMMVAAMEGSGFLPRINWLPSHVQTGQQPSSIPVGALSHLVPWHSAVCSSSMQQV